MNLKEKYTLIDQFILGRLSEEDMSEWEVLMKDETFHSEYIFRLKVYEASKKEGRQMLKERLGKLNQENTETQIKKSTVLIWYKIAAFVLLILAAYFLFNIHDETLSTDEIYLAYYEKLHNSLAPIERGESPFDSLKTAFIAYNKSEYTDALLQFEKLELSNPNVTIYMGIIKMEQGEYGEALAILEPISNDSNERFYIEARYYSALCQLKLGNINEASKMLTPISLDDSNYGKKALEIINKLKNTKI